MRDTPKFRHLIRLEGFWSKWELPSPQGTKVIATRNSTQYAKKEASKVNATLKVTTDP
jgi:hypothetical protein